MKVKKAITNNKTANILGYRPPGFTQKSVKYWWGGRGMIRGREGGGRGWRSGVGEEKRVIKSGERG